MKGVVRHVHRVWCTASGVQGQAGTLGNSLQFAATGRGVDGCGTAKEIASRGSLSDGRFERRTGRTRITPETADACITTS